MTGTLFLSSQFPIGKDAGQRPCSIRMRNQLVPGDLTREAAAGKQSIGPPRAKQLVIVGQANV